VLDYDGTLTPIVEEPEAARLSPAMRQALQQLRRHPRYRVAIVSGRALADLRARVDGAGLYLAGNHGLEIEGPEGRYDHPAAQRLRPQLEALAQALQRQLTDIPGAWVEDKGLTLSVHFRRVAAASVPEVQARVRRQVEPAVAEGLVRLRTGKAVLEIRPGVPWDKGEAVRWIVAQLRREAPAARLLALYVGDDDTDEDAFRAVGPQGVSIVVGAERRASAAQYYVESVADTERLLTILSGLS
jgi:trehalose 6-phosphate phosphatase